MIFRGIRSNLNWMAQIHIPSKLTSKYQITIFWRSGFSFSVEFPHAFRIWYPLTEDKKDHVHGFPPWTLSQKTPFYTCIRKTIQRFRELGFPFSVEVPHAFRIWDPLTEDKKDHVHGFSPWILSQKTPFYSCIRKKNTTTSRTTSRTFVFVDKWRQTTHTIPVAATRPKTFPLRYISSHL